MLEAYLITLNDLYIELANCQWYEFKRRTELNNLIEYYEKQLEEKK